MKITIKVGVGIMLSVILLLSNLSYGKGNQSEAGQDDQDLFRNLKNILSDEGLKGAIAGVSVRAADTGDILFEHHGDTRLTPASNMKLITAAAALDTLGHNYRFITDVATNGKIEKDVLKGDLYLIGRGDPTILKEDFDDFATTLKEKGINRIEGNLIGDESWYDTQRLSEDMIWTDESEYYGSQVSALTSAPNHDYDAGTIIVEVFPSTVEGESAKVTTSPNTDYVTVQNSATSVAPDEETEIFINRKHGTNLITVKGRISIGDAKERSWIAVSDPAMYALRLFEQSLKNVGITINENLQINKAPEDVTILTTKKSMPLHELLIPFMKLSNNGHGEILVKEMGKRKKDEGSWEAGLEVVNDYLMKEGLQPDNILIRDGSGISHVTLIQPNQLSMLLYKLQSSEWFNHYFTSLPVAGSKGRFVGGTLSNRMKGTAAENVVFAKTGTLQGVSSLSGYVKHENPMIFSIIINQFLDEDKIEEIEDRIAISLAEYNPE
ncbi:D-alanyl-D-alanine carboxypeptidase/D-alanyl-D-alanine-endopeptidase [Alkalihalobacillus sp. R86527]|uniref:D-alanyl-D-alanine carboxypeptidase/D-alanyl-D-alanine endopeptidase n=1 Tax=Alkalihalobacillus sp. R86527 TaxID=3093863 RepID=UPI00366F1EC9